MEGVSGELYLASLQEEPQKGHPSVRGASTWPLRNPFLPGPLEGKEGQSLRSEALLWFPILLRRVLELRLSAVLLPSAHRPQEATAQQLCAPDPACCLCILL